MNLDEIIEKARIFPIEIQVEEKKGITLWAGTDGEDYLLAMEKYVPFFDNNITMRTFIKHDDSTNLASLPSYQKFQQFIIENETVSI